MFEIIENGTVTSPKGYLAGATNVGIKTDTDELDVGILWTNNKDAYCTGVFTQNSIVSHSVTASRQNINGKLVKGVIANSGCANCGVGEQGLIDAKEVIKLTSEFLGCDENNLAICSTGLIGEELPMALIRKNISNIKLSKNDGKQFAKSILTTDTKTKEIAVCYEFNGKIITIGGCAKGVGMIHPNMATMLAFITTDAKLDNSFQDNILKRIVNDTFNMISVDGDQSTNDTVLLISNGEASIDLIDENSESKELFLEALFYVCETLAKELVSDGEGANHLIECKVVGAASSEDARKGAKSIIGSMLVKSMIHGRDPNWGRLMMALGKSGIQIIENNVDIYLNDIHIAHEGKSVRFSKESVITSMNAKEIKIKIDLNIDNYESTAWGCDLTEEYVVFNSAYST